MDLWGWWCNEEDCYSEHQRFHWWTLPVIDRFIEKMDIGFFKTYLNIESLPWGQTKNLTCFLARQPLQENIGGHFRLLAVVWVSVADVIVVLVWHLLHDWPIVSRKPRLSVSTEDTHTNGISITICLIRMRAFSISRREYPEKTIYAWKAFLTAFSS